MAFLLFVIGTIMGSFYLVVATRLPACEDILTSRSRCDHCHHTLKWYNLIPLLSYTIQRGRCSYCGKKIAIEHFLVELATGLLFLVTYFYFPIGYNFFVALIIASLLILIFVSDIKYMIILDSPLVIATILIFTLKVIYFGWQTALLSILEGIVLVAVMLLIRFIGNKIYHKDSLGGGDIKFSFVIGLILGIKLGLVALILSTFLALPYAVASVYLKKNSEFPYGPFLVGALLIVFYYYDKFLMLVDFLFHF